MCEKGYKLSWLTNVVFGSSRHCTVDPQSLQYPVDLVVVYNLRKVIEH